MPVRTAYVGTQVAGDVLTAANFSKLPGGWIGYAEVTANQASITTETDLTGLTVTVTVGSNRRIRVSAQGLIGSTNADGLIQAQIKEGGTALGRWAQRIPTTSDNVDNGSVVLTPSAGAHTYKLTLLKSGGTGSCNLGASATSPAFILVEDLGPAT